MSEWFDFLWWSAVYVVTLGALFDSARRLAERGFQRKPLFIVIVAAVVCIAFSGVQFFAYSAERKLLADLEHDAYVELSSDWGKDMQLDTREQASMAYVGAAFVGSGTLLHYFAKSGERTLLAPSQAQIREREAAVTVKVQLEEQANSLKRNAVVWLIYGVIATLLGWAVGHNARLSPANPLLDSDAPQETPRAG